MENPIKWLAPVLGLVLLCLAAPAGAQGTLWYATHPRRDQINKRLGDQDWRLKQGVKNGIITPEEAQQLRQGNPGTRQPERQAVIQNGGRITVQDPKALNRMENKESRSIHREKHPAGKP